MATIASKNNILQITTPNYTRVVDVNTFDYTHYTTKKSEKSDVPGMIAEFSYPQGKVVMTRSEKNHHIIIQNTAFSANSNTGIPWSTTTYPAAFKNKLNKEREWMWYLKVEQ